MRALAFLVAAALPAAAAAQIPLVLQHNGRLLGPEDTAMNGAVDITFFIYSVASDQEGTTPTPAKWKQKYTVQVTDGVYTVLLGAPDLGTPLPADLFDQPDRWLAIAVGSEATPPELKPRLRIGLTPYAARAKTAESADSAVSAQSATSAQTAVSAQSADTADLADVAGAVACTGCTPARTFNAASAAAPNVLLALDGNGKVPAAALPDVDFSNIDAALLDGHDTSATAAAGAIPILDGSGRLPAGMLPTAIDATTVGGKSPGTAAGNLVFLDGSAKVPLAQLPVGTDASSLNGHTTTDASPGDHKIPVLDGSSLLPVGLFPTAALPDYTQFTGVQRACSGGGVQTYNGTSKTWSACPVAWNCTSDAGHAGCVSSSQYKSCRAIKDDPGFNGGDRLYYVDPDASLSNFTPTQVWCDMTRDEGGWTMVLRTHPNGPAVWNVAGAVGTITTPSQTSAAKLTDAFVNALGYTHLRARGDTQSVMTFCQHDGDSTGGWSSNTNTHTRNCTHSWADAKNASWAPLYAGNNNTTSYHWIDTHDTMLNGCYNSCAEHIILHHAGWDNGTWYCVNGTCAQNQAAVAWVR